MCKHVITQCSCSSKQWFSPVWQILMASWWLVLVKTWGSKNHLWQVLHCARLLVNKLAVETNEFLPYLQKPVWHWSETKTAVSHGCVGTEFCHTHLLYAAILIDPIILLTIENLLFYHEDLISQELVQLFLDISTTQKYHALAASNDLPAEFSIPLYMNISALP